MSHVWGLFSHPDREMQVINRENETISHHYTHHVLLMAAIPVICAFIGTTQIGWNFGDGTILKLSWFTGLALAVLFYGVMPVSYTHLTLPTIHYKCRSRWSPYH